MDRITSPGDIVTGPRGSWVYVRSHVCSDKKDNIIVTVVEERKREKERGGDVLCNEQSRPSSFRQIPIHTGESVT